MATTMNEDDKRIINKATGLLLNSRNATQSWSLILIDPEFDDKIFLRNKAFNILIGILTEFSEHCVNKVDGILGERGIFRHPSIKKYSLLIKAHAKICAELLSIFKKSEFVYILENRDQSVHSILDESTKESRNIRYASNGLIVKEKVSRESYWEMWREIFLESKNLDEATIRLRSKFQTEPSKFWTIDDIFRNEAVLNLMIEDMSAMEAPRLFIGDDFNDKDCLSLREIPKKSLNQMRSNLVIHGENYKDPVTENFPFRGSCEPLA